MFSNPGFKEYAEGRIVLKDIDYQALRLIIQYFYTSKLDINQDNVYILLQTSNQLLIKTVWHDCCEFLKENIDTQNLDQTLAVAENLAIENLLLETKTYIKNNLTKLHENEQFSISIHHILEIFKQSEPVEEQKLLKYVLGWVRHDLERERYIDSLLECLPHVSHEDFRALLEEYNRGMEKNDFIRDQWTEGPKQFELEWKIGSALIILQKKAFIIGGNCLNTANSFDFCSKCWTECGVMKENRYDMGITAINKKIYVVGGYDGTGELDSAEVFDSELGRWDKITNMSTKRRLPGVTSANGKLFAVGGYDGNQILNSVECYNPLEDSWKYVTDSLYPRENPGIAELDGIIYVVGGYNTQLFYLKSVEAFVQSKNSWIRLADMNFCRKGPAVVAENGLLYVFGGMDEDIRLNSAEVYDPKTNIWTMLPESMNTGKYPISVEIVERNS